MFTIYDDTTRGSTAVSNLFIDQYMKDANDAQIKVYLYILRCLTSGRGTSVLAMADEFNHTEKDIIRSLRYWEKCGLLSIECDSCGNLSGIHVLEPGKEAGSSTVTASRVVSIAPALEEKTAEKRSLGSRESVDTDALRSFREDKKRESLIFVVEQYIGKPLSPTEFRTLCYICEDLHFSDELVDYLVGYCVDRGKKDFRYIEKVAINWSKEGITTPQEASKKALGTGSAGYSQFDQRDYNWNVLEQKILSN